MNEDSLLRKRVLDAIRISELKSRPAFVGFLDEFAAFDTINILEKQKVKNYKLWGGHKNANRLMLGVFPEYLTPECESFPVVTLFVSFSNSISLQHSDFLGALMSLGIKRDAIGDIIVKEDIAAIIVKNELADYIKLNLISVGRANVKFCGNKTESFLEETDKFEDIQSVIASNRIDCIISAFTKKSRSKSLQTLKACDVRVNYKLVVSSSLKINPNDIISIRGYGKYIVDSLEEKTKKGRIKLIARKYR